MPLPADREPGQAGRHRRADHLGRQRIADGPGVADDDRLLVGAQHLERDTLVAHVAEAGVETVDEGLALNETSTTAREAAIRSARVRGELDPRAAAIAAIASERHGSAVDRDDVGWRADGHGGDCGRAGPPVNAGINGGSGARRSGASSHLPRRPWR